MMRLFGDVQQSIHAAVGAYLGAFAADRDWAALLFILPLGVVFGAVHALTPGHSKTLLASYLIGSRLALLRGLAVSSALAATHVLSSVLIALFAVHLLTRTFVGAGRAPVLEDLSRGMLVAIGLWFLIRAIRGHRAHVRREGVAVGVIAGLVPCPLTLFVMVTALSRGVPEAGVAFAASMFVGIGLTLGAVAALSIVSRDAAVGIASRHGTSFARAARILDGISGLLLVVFGMSELLR